MNFKGKASFGPSTPSFTSQTGSLRQAWPFAFSKARLRYHTVSFQGTPKLFLFCFCKAPSEPSYLPRVGLSRGWLGGRRSRLSTSGCPWTAPIKEPVSAARLWELWEPRTRGSAGLRAVRLQTTGQLLGAGDPGGTPRSPRAPWVP